ncbi:ATP-dependent RNA helicase DDX51-like [Actinia tenebrosa]|uniref:ATP-dependent RNA helicase DDX51-like n=1 Tax=Actinia tenebrosa TaxID=6105 RepID=A0A6P8J117_ACTTE|nr:ATP-dependent RNA helicase DDX51-like [Actinia tenebrosa]
MELFVVKRYMGDGELTPNSKDDEAERLSLLKKHIEKRKRKLAIETKDMYEKDGKITKESNETEDVKFAKERERKAKVLLETKEKDMPTSNEEFEEAREKKKKKKRKKTKVNTCTSDAKEEDKPEMAEEKDINEITELKKKKKKNTEVEEKIEIPENVSGISENLKDSTEEIPKEICDSEVSKTDLGFTVIGQKRRNKDIKKVEKSLPDWLAKPQVVDTDLNSNLLPVDELDVLSKQIKNRLQELKITSLFPIQKAVIPTILNQIQKGSLYGIGGYRPSDICVSAPTGSGKTLAYVIPIVQALSTQTVCLLQALVLLPTKDLAFQVKQVFEAFVKGTGLKVGLASGNKALAKEQESLIGQGYGSFSHVNILVATPGRLVDHLSYTRHFTLQHLRFLVIDEADRLLDQSYHDWLNKVLKASYVNHSERQDSIGSLCNGYRRSSHLENSNPTPWGRFGYFLLITFACYLYDRLCLLIKLFGGIEVAEYSSNLNAQQRHGILRDFKSGSIHLLICSDAMARGMDIDNVSYVISYDAPKFVKTYIHRVGRTARGGNEGTAFTLLHNDQVHHFKELIQKTGRDKIPKQTFKDEEIQPLVEKYQNALKKLEETVKNEKQEQGGHKTRGQDEAEKYLQEQLLANIGK